MHSQTMFIAGHARLPAGMAAKNVYDMLTITVEIDKRFAVILEASCTLATEHGRDFVGRLLRGYSLQNGVEELIQHVKENYCGKAIHAIVAALSDLHFQYQQLKMVR
ncbi:MULTISPECIES: DUF3870 domain-containing protein [Bacillaceae]|uniref:DUF3870 domain-containing protein n=1 Tax=Bacillaceae TaxID=186817 RepID=UPI000C794BA3|nr:MULTISPECIES: DUF3870 domain-containing protein [Bacillaceae]PLR69908.1 hypothetical protein CYJ36_01885 [Bacillus sp. UMB0893]QNG59301.1 DUF3870 domain-containing protein [Bacillus sp. PAMC26568]